jgi:hypothetical protein
MARFFIRRLLRSRYSVVRWTLWPLIFLAIVATMSAAPWSVREDRAKRTRCAPTFSRFLAATPGNGQPDSRVFVSDSTSDPGRWRGPKTARLP